MTGRFEHFGRALDRCESYLEAAFLNALSFWREGDAYVFEPLAGIDGAIATSASGVLLYQQVAIELYRLDFLMVRGDRRLAVEVDGHDYHSSPEALTRDKARDRTLTSRGITPIRFTGREVNRDALACVREAHALAVGQPEYAVLTRLAALSEAAKEINSLPWEEQLRAAVDAEASAKARMCVRRTGT